MFYCLEEKSCINTGSTIYHKIPILYGKGKCAQMVALWICTGEIPGSNLNRAPNILIDEFHDMAPSLWPKCWVTDCNWPCPVPSKSLPLHYLLITLPLHVMCPIINTAGSLISHNWINKIQWNLQVTILFMHSTHLHHIVAPFRTDICFNYKKKIQKQNSKVAVARKGGFTNESLNIWLMVWTKTE